ncbi:MAG: hypothetical protein IPP32_00395 [Bacteroidetes bacterium]|nr:hypothetical protein [Bacteroidota bacterium]
MNKIQLKAALLYVSCFFYLSSIGQPNLGEIHGNFQTDVQYYNKDTLIGAPIVPEKVLMNGFANLNFTRENFSCGVRYESYLNALQGFDTRYKGNGFGFRYATYTKDNLTVTAGNFYDQFGSGLIFRSYEERTLGVDNAMDGLRLKYRPISGLYLKGFIAKQRFFFGQGEGIVRGADAEINVNELSEQLANAKLKVQVGGSFVSKYQQDKDIVYKLPENVASGGGRLKVAYGKFSFSGEYVQKINDPSTMNNFIYKEGSAVLLGLAYSQKGLGINLGAKRIDNMSFRSDRGAIGNNLMINYLPALTKQQSYNLAASIYPYASQPNGEMAYQAEVIYTLKKDSWLGGKYGTTVNVNYSEVHDIDKQIPNDSTSLLEPHTMGYKSEFLKVGETVFFKDFNVEITRKLSKKWKTVFFYANQVYNIEVVQGHPGEPTIYSNLAAADITYKINSTNAIRIEVEGLFTKQDIGSWAAALLEYTVAPHWSVAVLDQYNYGNPESEKQIHYYTGNITYTQNANRFSIAYGRQRAGLLCVGGVCRIVPASNGLTLSVSSSF